MPSGKTALILTEAGPAFGIGHWRRCQALASAFEEVGFKVELRQNDYSLPSKHFSTVVIDSYHLSENEYRAFGQVTQCLAVIDDNNRLTYPAQLVINPSLGAEKMSYQTSAALLLGSQYALLNRLYWMAQPVIIQPKVKTVLVTLGGSTLAAQTKQLSQQLAGFLPEIKFIYSTGQQTPSQMFQLYHQADLVISGGGQTLHELACLGLPTIAIELADNQQWNLQQWREVGFISSTLSIEDPQLVPTLVTKLNGMNMVYRQRVAKLGRQQVDGLGAQKVVKWISTHVDG
jgi:UDP-2,4-diacetamido-2,4,6-trideoxy-beta-L-altropyranose hydrolase